MEKYKKKKPEEPCSIMQINDESVMVHKFNLSATICRCGMTSIPEKVESSGGWKAYTGAKNAKSTKS